MSRHATTCRVCESACGLVAEVLQGEVVSLTPDRDHPVSRGFACVKGTRFHTRVQRHADRVVRPRLGRGVLTPVGWTEALGELGGRIAAIRAEHGPDAVALYSGNAAGHSLGAVLGLAALQRGLGTQRHYSCLTLDNSEQFVVAEEVFGSAMSTFVADYEGSDGILLIGTDPLSSQPSQSQSHPTGPRELRQGAAHLWVVDPRRSVTARAAALHLAPRPGTDVFLLAWLVREALAQRSGPAALAAAVAPFDTPRVVSATGLCSAALVDLRDRLLAADRPLVWSGLGVLLGPHGTLGWWLTVCLQGVLVGFDTPGGWRWQPGPVGLARLAPWLGIRGRDPDLRSSDGRFPAVLGTLAAATLPGDIRSGAVKALVVVGGDPARALPGSDASAALAALDLLVCVDLFINRTGELADAVLPAATWLERDAAGLHTAHQRRRGFVRVDRAVVPPRGEARTDWRILADLCRAAGRPLFGSRVLDRLLPADPAAALSRAVAGLRGGSSTPAGWRGVARLDVPEFLCALAAVPDPSPGLRMVTSVRPLRTMNHWLRDGSSPATAHPDTLPAGPCTLEGPGGRLRVVVESDPTLARDVVVVPFGGDPNPNALVGTHSLEAFTGQPWSNGTVVRVVVERDLANMGAPS
ncbi:MAG: anaerobic selenocysteine-containing dehydrogenase [Myxococcota bacterium]|jgi:anaerobic selenocysteine-containing dehydrogenase